MEMFVEQLFPMLTGGDRTGARAVVQSALDAGITAEQVAHEGFWPILEMIDQLFRDDQMSMLAHHYSTRLMRSLVDRVQMHYSQRTSRERSILLFSGETEQDELRAVLMADLAEADGYHVRFGGSGIANDEILEEVGQRRPDMLLMFASGPQDAPNIRQLIDTIHGVAAVPDLQVVVGGGVFNRAEGLAEEIGADLWGKSPSDLLTRMVEEPARRATAEQRTVGRTRRPMRNVA